MTPLEYEVNYKTVTIKTSDGSIITGKLNIHGHQRLSDYLKSTSEKFFPIISDQTEDAANNKTTLVNVEYIMWVNTDN